MVSFFFDSYAVIEILEGNPNYSLYSSEQMSFTIFNLAEIYWSSLKEYGDKKAELIYSELKPFIVRIDDETIKQAMRFKIQHRKKRLSYADCIGYTYAIRNKMKFLTGDREFKNFKNVEFVK